MWVSSRNREAKQLLLVPYSLVLQNHWSSLHSQLTNDLGQWCCSNTSRGSPDPYSKNLLARVSHKSLKVQLRLTDNTSSAKHIYLQWQLQRNTSKLLSLFIYLIKGNQEFPSNALRELSASAHCKIRNCLTALAFTASKGKIKKNCYCMTLAWVIFAVLKPPHSFFQLFQVTHHSNRIHLVLIHHLQV